MDLIENGFFDAFFQGVFGDQINTHSEGNFKELFQFEKIPAKNAISIVFEILKNLEYNFPNLVNKNHRSRHLHWVKRHLEYICRDRYKRIEKF